MIINIMFRDVFSKYFTTGPYTYKCDLDVEVGDLVLVETRFGISIAQVESINRKIRSDNTIELKNVLEKCKTTYPLPISEGSYEKN